ncbi:MAG: hypothetical protein U9N35_04355 [Euryarchaeota archaeon]|nr:hypothetical protein [Euryarchaeota archaeon]
MKDKVIGLFFNKKTLEIFLNIEEKYAAKIRNKVGCMYSYTTMRLDQFEKVGLATSHRDGRKNVYELTEKGKKLKNKLEEIVNE